MNYYQTNTGQAYDLNHFSLINVGTPYELVVNLLKGSAKIRAN
jgi:hypothetical protein